MFKNKLDLKSLSIGFILGGIFLGSISVGAVEYIVKHNTYPIMVNGTPSDIEALNVNDLTYVKLRDVSKALGGIVDVKFNEVDEQIEINNATVTSNPSITPTPTPIPSITPTPTATTKEVNNTNDTNIKTDYTFTAEIPDGYDGVCFKVTLSEPVQEKDGVEFKVFPLDTNNHRFDKHTMWVWEGDDHSKAWINNIYPIPSGKYIIKLFIKGVECPYNYTIEVK